MNAFASLIATAHSIALGANGSFGGGAICYRAGEQRIEELDAVFGKSPYQMEVGGFVRLMSTDRDFIVKSCDLAVGGARITPLPGHRITDLASDEEFEVISLGEGCYQSSDQFGVLLENPHQEDRVIKARATFAHLNLIPPY